MNGTTVTPGPGSNSTTTNVPGATTADIVGWVVFSLATFLAVVSAVIVVAVVASLKKRNRITTTEVFPTATVTGKSEDEISPTKWQQAATFIKEGVEHIKFSDRPTEKISNFVYMAVNSIAYRIYHLLLTVALLLLAFLEFPTVFLEEDPSTFSTYQSDWLRIVAVFEFVILLFLLLDLTLTMIWLKPRKFFTRKGKVVESVLLLLMFIEVVVVMARNDYHPRVLRALRPVFFVNSQLMYDMRRVMKEIFQVFTTILDVILLLLFLVAIFAIFGYYLLASSNPDYFSTYGQSFVSMFVLVTTANFPDVMLESYHVFPYSPIFFVIYLIITLYIIANVILAVIYSSFSDAAKKKFKKVLIHKREALHHAYEVLEASDSSGVNFQDFLRFMEEFRPEILDLEVMCIYRALQNETATPSADGHTTNPSLTTPLTLNQFYSLYRVIDLSWRKDESKGGGIRTLWGETPCLRKVRLVIHKIVTWQWFDAVISVIVLINIICAIAFAAQVEKDDLEDRYMRAIRAGELATSFLFTGIYTVEILLRIIGLGFINYFKSVWNICDFLVILISVIAQLLELHPALRFATLVRPLKLLRLLRLKRRYQNILNTVGVLIMRIISVMLLLIATYYFFAIIGMEAFRYEVYPQCCENGWFFVGGLYHGAQNSTLPNVYWLNNFNNILRSYVTLFELMVINNWFFIMEGFASEVTEWKRPFVRLYFMFFYICVLTFTLAGLLCCLCVGSLEVVTTVIISLVVEAFTFRLALGNEVARKKRICKRDHDENCKCCQAHSISWKVVQVEISQTDVTALNKEVTEAHALKKNTSGGLEQINKTYSTIRKRWKNLHSVVSESESDIYHYVGYRRITQNDLYLLMYQDEVKHWTEEHSGVQDTDNAAAPEPNLWKRKLKKKLIDFIEFVFE